MHCRCCRKIILNANSVDLFGKNATKENIREALEKYGGLRVGLDEKGKSTICRSCFTLLKGINDRVRKIALLCTNAEQSSVGASSTDGRKRTYTQQKSPASKILTPSKILNRLKRIRPATSAHSSESSPRRERLLVRFSETSGQPEVETTPTSARVKETRSHEILQFAGLRSTQVHNTFIAFFLSQLNL